jgi:protein involved in polysaccharide export with SLBB domain
MKKVLCALFILMGTVPAFAAELEVVDPSDLPAPVVGEKAEVTAPVVAAAAQATPSITRAEDETMLTAAQRGKKVMPAPPKVAVKTDEPTRYTLGPDDIIEIVVRRHPEFSDKFIVNAEGKIQYKFVGDIEVKGMSKTELKERITQVLSKYIITPDVDISILDYRSKVIYVIGEVGAPGKYFMKADKISLREAVVQAGLPTLSASMRKTFHIRPDKNGKPNQERVDLYALLYEGNLDRDMQPGDVVYVPATIFAKIMRIISPITSTVASSDTIRRAGTGGI